MKMETKIMSWWNSLSSEEKALLKTMLYNMTVEDFLIHGVETNNEGKYVNVENE